MRECILPNIDNGIDLFSCYDAFEFPYDSLSKTAIKSNRKRSAESYLTTIATFDIETTTIGGLKPYGFMYHWQMCLDGNVLYGRTWMEWEHAMKKLVSHLEVSTERRLVIWVHNLGFEHQFMKEFVNRSLGGYEMFATQNRKPLRINTGCGIEFRCSWKLSNMSLEKFTENEKGVRHRKQIGDLDYRKIRTPETRLTDKEFGYCIADVISLYEAIKCRLENEHDNLESIPMTSTGYVRRDCRRATSKDRGYRSIFKSCQMDKDTYLLLKDAARGGDTHANRKRAGRIVRDVDSYDVQSSYPAMMMLRKYPMTKFTWYGDVESMAEFRKVLSEHACLFRLNLVGVHVKDDVPFPYISEDKCQKCLSPILDNGRVISAKGLSMTLTDVDWTILEEQYEFEEMYVYDIQIAEYGWLPESLLSVVMDYFRQKTQLKAQIAAAKRDGDWKKAKDLEYLYGKSKNRLNGIFGMCFTDPVHDIVEELEDGTWKTKRPDIEEALEKYYGSRNSFLVYAWGAWVTAHARRHLADLVKAAGWSASLYCDTDSDKCQNPDYEAIEALNRKIERQCEERGAYADADGQRYYLGIYEKETKRPYRAFKTLGAKKYCHYGKDGLHITISGVRKRGAREMRTIYNFRPGFTFRESAGLEMHYHENEIHKIHVEGTQIETASGIAAMDGTYRISLTGEYEWLLGRQNKSIKEIKHEYSEQEPGKRKRKRKEPGDACAS